MQFKHHYKNGNNQAKDDWGTPDYIYDPLDRVFRFQLDAAASSKNAKNKNFYSYISETNNGLVNPWTGLRTFCNPPYTEGQYGLWIEKGVMEYRDGDTFVLLLPGSWETRAFEPVWNFAKYLIFPYKRIKYDPPPGTPAGGATFTSLIPVLTSRELKRGDIRILEDVGRVVDLRRGLLEP